VVLSFIELMSKTITLELPLPTNRTLPSAVVEFPSGPGHGFTPLPREAQHCAPGKPPRLPLAPKPVFKWKVGPPSQARLVLQAYLTKLPNTSTVGGITSTLAGGVEPGWTIVGHGLAPFPASETPFWPWIEKTARSWEVSITCMAMPMRSEMYLDKGLPYP